MKLRAYLVDDEPLALERLCRLLQQTGRVEVIGSATEPERAVAALATDPPDVCFLDIHMPRLNGFELLARLPRQPLVVFTTAYDQHALRAFSVNAIDYLVKPIDPRCLDRALAKIERLGSAAFTSQPDLQSLIKELSGSLRERRLEYPERIASRLGDRIGFLDLSRVTHFYAEDRLTYAVSEAKAYCVDYAIAELERTLDPRKFIRIHRGTVVNIAWIREVASLPGGALHVRLRDNKETELVVARDRVREFRARLSY